ncbi:MAG: hypothetical protein AAF928_00100 [Myxococcota bacterium]
MADGPALRHEDGARSDRPVAVGAGGDGALRLGLTRPCGPSHEAILEPDVVEDVFRGRIYVDGFLIGDPRRGECREDDHDEKKRARREQDDRNGGRHGFTLDAAWGVRRAQGPKGYIS